MNYENKPCPGCGAHMHEEDDIVVCPVCATPQHRACWQENNCCVNEAKHADGYLWTPNGNNIDSETQAPAQDNDSDAVVFCHICGSENPKGVTHCGQCGAVITYSAEQLVHCNFCGFENPQGSERCKQCGAPLIVGGHTNYNPYASAMGVDSNEKIGEHTAGELALYVRKKVPYYLSKFRDQENGQNLSFNWAAFIFGPIWFFYRKVYKAGILFLTASASISMIFAGALTKIEPVLLKYEDQITNMTLSNDQLMEIYSQMGSLVAKPFAVAFALLFAVSLACGLLGNRLYYKKIQQDLTMFAREVPDTRMQQAFIARRGGTSIMTAVCGMFTYQFIQNLLTSLATFVSEHM